MMSKSLRPMALAITLLVLAAGCDRDAGTLKPWPLPTDQVVFQDAFTGAVNFEAFGNSKLDALGTDQVEQYEGTGCLRVTVPNPGAGYAGGAFIAPRARDLTGYNALTFWAKASKAVTIDVAGFGNDNRGTSKYEASRAAVAVTTTWTKKVVPIPDASRLAAERGLFFFAAAPQAGSGYVLWFDDVRFERLDTITNPQPAMAPQTLNAFVGSTITVSATRTSFDVAGSGTVTVNHMVGYYDYASSNPTVASVENGAIRILATGDATISATLADIPVSGAVTLNAAPFPAGQAPPPPVPPADVISLFSNAYVNRPVDRWSATWDNADVADLSIFGDDIKAYTRLVFAGIEFTTHPVDATAMAYLHVDVYAPAGSQFKIKLVDFGSDGAYGGTGDAKDTERELTFGAATTPPFVPGSWVGLDIPLADFMDPTTGLASRAHLAQMILAGDVGTVYLDNIYFHK